MVRIGLRLRMTSQAIECGIVGGVRVAIAARVRAPVICREPGMRKGCPSPLSGRVASLTRRRESRRCMVRIVCRFILALMTRIAVCGSPRVLPSNMAARTGYARMRSRQGKGGLGVIETGRYPSCSAVADLAVLRESRTLMIRIGCSVVDADMARHTALIQPIINPA